MGLLFLINALFSTGEIQEKNIKKDTLEQRTQPDRTPTPTLTEDYEDEIEEPLDSLPNFLKIEVNGEEKIHYYSSQNPDRPDISVQKYGKIVFERRIPLLLTTAEDYTVPMGKPEIILTGSSFYGQNVTVYVYEKGGVGFIANDEGIVLEQHLFPPNEREYYLRTWAQK